MRHTPPRRFLAPAERQRIQREIQDLEQGAKSPTYMIGDSGQARWAEGPVVGGADAMRRAARLKKILEDGTPADLSRKAKSLRDKRIRELEERVKKRMVPSKFFYQKREDSKDYNKTVDHLVKLEQNPQHQTEVTELKNLLRERSIDGSRLHGSSENPACSSIEYLRK